MDVAVSLVQSYLNVNGYFTVAEYPILEVAGSAQARMATDLDILAFRFPNAGRRKQPFAKRQTVGDVLYEPDPALKCPAGKSDMIVGEVKEGRADLNPAARNPLVLAAALTRFGCCSPEHAPEVVAKLLKSGQTRTGHGHVIRMIAFGNSAVGNNSGLYQTISLAHVVTFLRDHIKGHWETIRHAQFKDQTMVLLALLEKVSPRYGASPASNKT